MAQQLNKNARSDRDTRFDHDPRSDRDQIILSKLGEIISDNTVLMDTFLLKLYSVPEVIVKEFIRENKRILYGGIAINALLKQKEKPIYKDTDFPDYDFYSPDSVKDAYIIANKIYDAGFKYVRIIPAIHSGTVRVQIDFKIIVADITFLPEKYLDVLSKKNIDGLWYTDENVLKITLYQTLGSINDIYRWKKDYNRIRLLEEFYPIIEGDTVTKDPKITKKPSNTALGGGTFKKLFLNLNEIIGPDNYCITGKLAYTIIKSYVEGTNKGTNKGFPIEISLVNGELFKVINGLFGLLRKFKSKGADGGDITLDIFSGETEDIYLPVKYVLSVGGVPVIIIYDYFGKSLSKIGVQWMTIKNINILSHTRLVSYFYSLLAMLEIPKEKHFSAVISKMYTKDEIIKLICNIGKFFKRKELGDNVLQIFSTEYIGTNIDKKSMEYKKYISKNKYAHKAPIIKLYEPDFGRIEVNDIKFIKKTDTKKISSVMSSTKKRIVFYPFDFFGALLLHFKMKKDGTKDTDDQKKKISNEKIMNGDEK